ncbi:hypothetical protein AWG71_13350 [Escherichia coli]|nr:hypothetical protein AWG71_13350 [Escherichia coli]
MMNPVPWLQMTNMISYQGLVRTFPKLNIVQNHRRENQYKANKNISNAMLNILDWFERYPDIVKNINQA